MATSILGTDQVCEICGGIIPAGDQAVIHSDYDWDNPDEDMQGSVMVSFYRHVDPATCQNYLTQQALASAIRDVQTNDLLSETGR
jgi:hypothetical protein